MQVNDVSPQVSHAFSNLFMGAAIGTLTLVLIVVVLVVVARWIYDMFN